VRLLSLLIAQDPLPKGNFLAMSLKDIRLFIRRRLSKYADHKYANRHFFPSAMLKNFIDEVRCGE
jgi:hypothetical protein